MNAQTPRAVDPNFAQSIADGLTESYEAYCQRLDASDQPASQHGTHREEDQ